MIPIEPTQLNISWGITMQIWWSYVWRCGLFSALLAVPLGAIGGITVAIIGRPDLGGSVGGILGYPVSIIMYYAKDNLTKTLQKLFYCSDECGIKE
jgi:hypothetical protein